MMSDRNTKFEWDGLWLALPAVAFLLLYMSAQQFTVLDHAIAVVFVAVLAYGTYALQQKQKRRRLERARIRDRND
jgi:hypothetical protein